LITDDPAPNSGLIAEFVTTPSELTLKITPGVIGWTDAADANVPINITNLSGVSGTVTVTCTALPLED
jgi:hypothetical protein